MVFLVCYLKRKRNLYFLRNHCNYIENITSRRKISEFNLFASYIQDFFHLPNFKLVYTNNERHYNYVYAIQIYSVRESNQSPAARQPIAQPLRQHSINEVSYSIAPSNLLVPN